MEPLQPVRRLQLAYFDPVDEVSDPCGFFVLNCCLVDFDVDGPVGLPEVGLEHCISQLFLVLCIQCVAFLHLIVDDLASIDRVRLAEELEDILAVKRISFGQVLAEGALARGHYIHIHVLAQLDVLDMSHITHHGGYVFLNKVVKRPIVSSHQELRTKSPNPNWTVWFIA